MAKAVSKKEKNQKTSDKVNDFMQKNRKIILIVVGIILLAAIGISVFALVKSSSSSKLLDEIYEIEYKYANGASDADESALLNLENEALDSLKPYLSKSGITGVRANMLAASISWQKSDFETAASYYKTAYEVSKKSTYTRGINAYNAAVAFEEAGKNEEALDFYQKAIDEKFEYSAHAYFNIGRIKEALSDSEGALAAYQKVTDDYSSDNWALLAKSRILSLNASSAE